MGIRITQALLTNRTLRDLNNQLLGLSKLQEQLATGRRVNSPSDDPIDARRAINIRAEISRTEQYIANLDDLQPQLRGAEGIFDSTLNILQRTLELTVRAANETLNQDQLDITADEIDQLLEQVFLESNERINGRTLFGGTVTLTDPFVATRDAVTGEISGVTYQGNGEEIAVKFSDETTLAVNRPGDEVYLSDVDIFAVLIGIRDDLRAGDQDNLRNTRLGEIDTAQNQILRSLSKIGAVQNRVEEIANFNEDFVLNLQEQLSDKIDADYAETVLNFNVQQNLYNSALNASARVLQNSLLDFIR